MIINMNRSMELGPDIARWIESRTELDTAMGDLATDVSRELIPLARTSTEAATEIVALLNMSFEFWRDTLQAFDWDSIQQFIVDAIPMGGAIGQLIELIRDGIREYRREKELNRAFNEREFLEGFQTWLHNQAQPMDMEILRQRRAAVGGG
jgi:hypothetical protein